MARALWQNKQKEKQNSKMVIKGKVNSIEYRYVINLKVKYVFFFCVF